MKKQHHHSNQPQPHEQQQQQKAPKQPQQQQQQQQQQPVQQQALNQNQASKQKLISKTHIQNKTELFTTAPANSSNSKPAPQIKILARNTTLNATTNPTAATTSATATTSNKNTALSSIKTQPNASPYKSSGDQQNFAALFKQSPASTTQTPSNYNKNANTSQNYQRNTNTNNNNNNNNNNNYHPSSNNASLMEILKNSSFSNKQTPQVPVGTTTELSPAPSSLPIPFGLSTGNSNSNAGTSARRNILLEQLGLTPNSGAKQAANATMFTQDFLNSTQSLPVGLHQSTTSSSETVKQNNPLAKLFPSAHTK